MPRRSLKSSRRGPNFLYIGAAKAGSTWLHHVLKEHPEVFVPEAKDIKFFDRYYGKGLKWYESHFTPSQQHLAVGELSHDYFLDEDCARKISSIYPDIKLICCLREPVERTLSEYHFRKSMDLPRSCTFEEFAFQRNTIKKSSYYTNLVPFYRSFDSRNILIIFFDELQSNPASFARQVFKFLGVKEEFTPSVLYRKLLSAREPRYHMIAQSIYKCAQITRLLGFPNLVGIAKHNSWIEQLLYRNLPEKDTIPSHVRHRVREIYTKDYERLSELIGRNIPEPWYHC